MAQNTRNNVLIVGGSSGVGLAVGKLALSHLPNANIILSSTNKENLEAAVKQLQDGSRSSGASVDYVVGDVSNFETQFADVERVLQEAMARLRGKIDHIIWTAGRRPSSVNSNERSNNDIIELATS